jgi:hypothetical protein
MFTDLWHKHREWVLDPLSYDSVDGLVNALDEAVIGPALGRRDQLELKKAEALVTRHTRNYESN